MTRAIKTPRVGQGLSMFAVTIEYSVTVATGEPKTVVSTIVYTNYYKIRAPLVLVLVITARNSCPTIGRTRSKEKNRQGF